MKGEIFGLLGPNGAGKTTTIRTLLGLIKKTSGEAKIFGLDIDTNSIIIRQRTAYLPGELGLYGEKTARRNINFILSMYNEVIPQRIIEEIAERIGLNLDRKVKELSKGNKQKVGIVLAMAPKKELLILDEPTSGLDPLITADFYKMLKEKQENENCSVILSSHLLNEVERVAKRVGIIRNGTIVEISPVEDLKKMIMKEVKIVLDKSINIDDFAKRLLETGVANNDKTNSSNIINNFERMNHNSICFFVKRDSISQLLDMLNNFRNQIVDIDITSPTLEDIFMKYYKLEENPKMQLSDKSINNFRSIDNDKQKEVKNYCGKLQI